MITAIIALITTQSPVNAQSCIEQAQRLMAGERFAEAIASVNKCPLTPASLRLKGIAFYCLYNTDSAHCYLRLAEKSTAVDDSVLVGLAGTLMWKKDSRAALSVLEKVRDKKGLSYQGAKALIHEAKGEYPQALAMYDTVIATHPKAFSTMAKKASVLSWMKKYDESITLYTAIINASQASLDEKTAARIRRAEVISWTNRLDEAIVQLDSTLMIDSKNATALVSRGVILEWKGKFKEAKESYSRALSADPNNKTARLNIEKLLWVK